MCSCLPTVLTCFSSLGNFSLSSHAHCITLASINCFQRHMTCNPHFAHSVHRPMPNSIVFVMDKQIRHKLTVNKFGPPRINFTKDRLRTARLRSMSWLIAAKAASGPRHECNTGWLNFAPFCSAFMTCTGPWCWQRIASGPWAGNPASEGQHEHQETLPNFI